MLIRASGANAPRRRVMSPCRIHASPSIKYFDELAQPIAWGSASEVTALMFAVLASLPVFSTRRASTNLCVSNKRMNAYTCLRLSRINDVESAWDAVRLLRFKGLHWGYRLLQTRSALCSKTASKTASPESRLPASNSSPNHRHYVTMASITITICTASCLLLLLLQSAGNRCRRSHRVGALVLSKAHRRS